MSESQFRKELAKARKTIRGLNELLRDSEEATVRLGEQAKLLKEEIRRLERNREREEGVSNMEYLKNVVLKVNPSHNICLKLRVLLYFMFQLHACKASIYSH